MSPHIPADLVTATFDSAPIAVAVFDTDLRHVTINAAYARLSHRPAADIIGRRPDELASPLAEHLLPGLRKALERQEPVEVFLHLSGDAPEEQRHCVGLCWQVQAEGREAVAVMLRDVTERTRADIERQRALTTEQALRREAEQQRDFIRLVLENAPMSISVCEGPDFRLALINDFALRLIGMNRDEVVGKSIAETFPEAFTLVRDVYERVYRTGETITVPERMIPLPDGRHVCAYSCYAPVCEPDGTGIGVMSLGLDITALKQAQAIVEAQKRVLEMIARGAGLSSVLDAVAGTMAESMRDLIPSIQLVQDGRLRAMSAAFLPAGFAEAIDGLQIGPNGACCGTAAYLGQRIVTTDIASDPRWASYRSAAVAHGVRSCCSTPIVGSSGVVLGTLALYSAKPGSPTEEQLRLVDLMVRTVVLAVERQNAEDERARLLEAERHARQAAEQASRSKDEFVATLRRADRRDQLRRPARDGGSDVTAGLQPMTSAMYRIRLAPIGLDPRETSARLAARAAARR